jgi:hypothetical protein
MKIRSKEKFHEIISEDLAWRKKELTLIKSRVDLAGEKKLNSEIRSGVLLLYAHWEGFVKFSSECYLDYVKYLKLNYNELCDNLLALSAKSFIHELENTHEHGVHLDFIKFFQQDLNSRARWNLEKAIDTKSNLNSGVLKNILSVLGIPERDFELKYKLIDEQLLKNRNTIAHGNYLIIGKNEYLSLHSEILGLINTLRNHIENSVLLKKYKKTA